PRLVQRADVALRRKKDRANAGAGIARLAEEELDIHGFSREGRVDQLVDRERGGIRDYRPYIVDLDPLLAARIERELADLAARRETIAAQEGNEHRARVGRDAKTGVAHFRIDQAFERLLVVLVTRQGDRVLRLFADDPQRRILAQL